MKQHIDDHLQEIPYKIVIALIVGALAFYAGFTQPVDPDYDQVLGVIQFTEAN